MAYDGKNTVMYNVLSIPNLGITAMLHLKKHILDDLNCILLHLWCASDLAMASSFLSKSLVVVGKHYPLFHYVHLHVWCSGTSYLEEL